MSTSNETIIAPNSGSGPETNSTLQSNGQAGERDSNPSTINSNQGQQVLRDDERSGVTGDEEPIAGTSGNFPIANAALASCNAILEDYRSSRISKGIALCRIYTTLLEAVPDDESTPATVEEAFSRFLTIIENHQGHLAEVEHCGCHQCSDSPQPIPEGNPDNEDLEDIPPPKQAKPDDLKFPWTISDFIHGATLSPSLSKSLELLKLYAIDPKGTK